MTGFWVGSTPDLLVDQPEIYGLPRDPKLPSRNLILSSILSTLGAVAFGLFGLMSLRKRRMDEIAERRQEPEENHV